MIDPKYAVTIVLYDYEVLSLLQKKKKLPSLALTNHMYIKLQIREMRFNLLATIAT